MSKPHKKIQAFERDRLAVWSAQGIQIREMARRQPVTVCKKDEVVVEERIDGTIHIRLRRCQVPIACREFSETELA